MTAAEAARLSLALSGPMITVAVLPEWSGTERLVRVERLVLSPGPLDRPAWTTAATWRGTLSEWRAALHDALTDCTDEDAGEVAHG